ncbi:MAG TPA: acyl-CoA synthetase [Acidimicrobiia bacterium]|jgi:fatty-acyl-CoA synthase|nr:acyl-CoA synthetase [Acidimicrobiia bacterium]
MFYCAPMEFNLADLFEVVADRVPDRLALVAGEARRTYRELDERSNRVAHHLAAAGVGPGDHVAVYAWNRAEWIEAELGIYKARAAVVNVNYRYVAGELAYILENSDAVAVVVERSFAPVLLEARASAPRLRHVLVLEDGGDDPASGAATGALAAVRYEDALAAASPARGFGPRAADDPYLLYTGGTTGVPKGVVWRAEDIFFAALGGGGFGLPPITRPEELADRVAPAPAVGVVNAPMMHGGGQWVSFIGFYAGDTVVLNCDRHYDGDAVLRLAERERATSIMVVGDAMARPLADALAAPAARYDLGSLAAIGSGGAILSKAVKEELRARLPGVRVTDSFGASETGAAGTVLDFDGPAAGPRFTISDWVAVLDDDGRRVEPGSGQVGRLARRGHIPLAYYKDPAKTAATFVTDPDGVRWVVPGDFAVVEADGTLNLLGRGSVCINTGGEKVYPEEVEAALKAHPGVFDAVVVGVPDDRLVERVAAIVTPRGDARPSLPDLQACCRARLAGYKVPRQLELTDDIPRTPVGKPDYRWARRLAEHSAPARKPTRTGATA